MKTIPDLETEEGLEAAIAAFRSGEVKPCGIRFGSQVIAQAPETGDLIHALEKQLERVRKSKVPGGPDEFFAEKNARGR